MGFCTTINPYTNREVLCCDFCNDYPARKIPCPFGYCQAYAMCKKCRLENKGKEYKEKHRKSGCEKNHLEYKKTEDERETLLNAGYYLRRCALSNDAGDVKVLFQNKEGDVRAFWMSPETYHLIPLGANATIKDFMDRGGMDETTNLDIHDRQGVRSITKEVQQ